MRMGLKVLNIAKSYNGNPVLRGCTFSFEQNGVYVLTGANGCGKSTFLRICALLEKPDSGENIYQQNESRLPEDMYLRRKITLVLPKIGLFNTTVYRNVAYGLSIRGCNKKEEVEKVNSALEAVGLCQKKDQQALTLSSGEAQRLGIARALAIDPEILFLDEPTASVDEKNTEFIEQMILDMKKQGRPTIILTTHDKDQARRLADTLIVLKDGTLLKQ